MTRMVGHAGAVIIVARTPGKKERAREDGKKFDQTKIDMRKDSCWFHLVLCCCGRYGSTTDFRSKGSRSISA